MNGLNFTFLKLMKDYPLVSFIIPVYNGEGSILNCIESVLSQNYQNIEIVVIDDCSSDETLKIIENINNKINDLNNIFNP